MKDGKDPLLIRRLIRVMIGLVMAGVLIITILCSIPEIAKNPILRRGERFFEDHDYRSAYKTVVDGMKKYPNHEGLRFLFVKIINTVYSLQFSGFEYTDHNAILNRIIENSYPSHHPDRNAELLAEIGYYFWLTHKQEKAREYLERALALNERYYPLYNYLGNYYFYSDFARAMGYYKKLFTLNPRVFYFAGLDLDKDYIFKRIVENKKIKVLFLSGSNERMLQGLANLKGLEVLSLTQQDLTSHDLRFVKDLKNLRVLSLHANRIERIEGLDNLTQLKALYLNDNQISRIENLDRLIHLETLNLRSNRIGRLENLTNLVNLKRLYLRSNRIGRLENLDGLTNLEILDLYDNRINTLENLGALSNLKILDLYFNQINKLENLEPLKELRSLYLRQNRITRLENLEKLTRLRILDLYKNQVTKLENLDRLVNLEELILVDNQIGKLENLETLTKLKILDLRMNEIERIENLNSLTDLNILSLSFNKISRLENLETLTNLHTLHHSYNQITKIENLEGLTNLRNLYLGGGTISKIENLEGLTELNLLYLSGNKITRIENLSHLTSLRTLNLGSNLIERLENLDGLVNLETLDLYKNRITRLENLEGLPGLRHLYLAFNQFGMDGETVLEIPPSLARLKSLIINGPAYIEPGDIRYVRGIENCMDLETFELAYQNLKEIPDLSSLKKLKRILIEKSINMHRIDFNILPTTVTSLVLWNVNLKDLEGIERLVNLKELWIGDNLALASLSRLREINTLRQLNVSFCSHLPWEEIDKLHTLDTLLISAEQYPESVIRKWEKSGIRIRI